MIGIVFGRPILGSLQWFVLGKAVGDPGTANTFTDSSLYGLVLRELLVVPFAAVILHVQGWRVKDFPVGVSIAATVLGVGMGIAGYAGDWLIETVTGVIFPAVKSSLEAFGSYKSPSLDMTAIVTASLVNPVFEEVFVCGYVIEALRKEFGATTAVNVSVIIRASYHLYQGGAMLPFHVAYGLMQAYAYMRFRKLWPLIVSHAILDFVGLASLL